jgi:hypothetical protein
MQECCCWSGGRHAVPWDQHTTQEAWHYQPVMQTLATVKQPEEW